MRKMTEDFIGTCQWCFGEYKTNGHKVMVLHGYQRPGHGSTVGRCMGVGHPPFEYAHDLTERRIALIAEDIRKQERALKAIDDGKITKVRNPNFLPADDPRRRYRYSGDIDSEYFEVGHKQFPHYLRVLRGNIEGELRYFRGVKTYLDEAVQNWTRRDIVGIDTPATGRERYIRDAYDPDAEAQRQANAEAKAIRDAKPGKITVNVMARFPFPNRQASGLTDEEFRKAWAAFDEAEKAFKDKVKKWAKARFPGKTWVGDGDSYGAERASGLPDFGVNDRSVCVAFRAEWQYADEIMAMFPDAYRYDKDTARRDPVTKQGIGKGKDIRIWVPASAIPF